ncbi:MAG TPA: choice-of-anchor R domain-containing protein [Candidatus Limnocylindria bacterium]|nr:choice-of-anchor R domain-containing protein [Candidatus Limnocylindria bacterium]
MKTYSSALLLILAAAPLLADTQISSLGQSTDLTFNPYGGAGSTYGSPFVTGPLTYQLDSISGLFSNAGGTVKISGASIYSDVGGEIGIQLAVLSDAATSAHIGNSTQVFNEFNPFLLTPNTTYWAVFNGYGAFDANYTQAITLQPGVDAGAAAGWSKPNQLQYLGQAVENNISAKFSVQATAVPEASTYGIAAAGALGAFALIRRKRSA